MSDTDELDGVGLIAAERTRQKEVEGFAPEHDDEHTDGSLAQAGAAYALAAADQSVLFPAVVLSGEPPIGWPGSWGLRWWKPSIDPIRNLAKAGALIAAEIDRLRRQRGEQ